MSDYSILDFDGRNGRALNLEGFTNFQKPIPVSDIEKAVAEGTIVAISPEGLSRLNDDLAKAIKTDFEGIDKFNSAVLEIRTYRNVIVDRGGKHVEYLIKAVPQKEEAADNLEKGDEYWALRGGIAEGEKQIPLKKTGAEIKTAFEGVITRLKLENGILSAKMSECVVALGKSPTDQPYDSFDRTIGNRYSWEDCRALDPVEGAMNTVNMESAPATANHCRMYNSAFETLCSNIKAIKMASAYIANVEDNKSYDLKPDLYLLLF